MQIILFLFPRVIDRGKNLDTRKDLIVKSDKFKMRPYYYDAF
jgi:hypothetical protein